MDPSPSLVSVQVGPVVTYPAPGPGERKWRSAIAKHPVVGPIFLDLLGLNGDAQADKKHHGGNTQAVNVYPSEHYQHWIHTPGFEKMNGGSFGENLTTLGLLETSVCIGDIFRINQAVVWVTQPRVPCYKLDRRWQRDDLREQASESGRVGWYFGVRQPGTIQAGDAIELLERPNPNWTIARVWSVYQTPGDHDAMVELSQASGLSQSWRNMLQKMLETSA